MNSYAHWVQCSLGLVGDLEAARSHLDRRLLFLDEVGRALLSSAPETARHVVYGVWIISHTSPIYVGQTSDAKRRLYDLPIGESHHLANSFPPEVWERVVVLRWPTVLGDALDELERQMGEALLEAGRSSLSPRSAIGQVIEFLLQSEKEPLFNARKKVRGGSWRSVNWVDSSSLCARLSPLVLDAMPEIRTAWDHLSGKDPQNGASREFHEGTVVYPHSLWRRSFS